MKKGIFFRRYFVGQPCCSLCGREVTVFFEPNQPEGTHAEYCERCNKVLYEVPDRREEPHGRELVVVS